MPGCWVTVGATAVLFSSTLTLLLSWLATARSGLPSPLKSATATEAGLVPTAIVDGGREGAVAVAEEHAHGVAAVVGDGEVGLAVAVQVRHRDRAGPQPGGVVDRGGEGAVAVAEQHAHGVAAVVGDGEVGLAVAVEVRHRDRGRLVPGGVV